jgi:CRISPR/Cas system-associated exonuclease Cas4 (RecB family)
MSGLDWPRPKPAPLASIAPTLANTLLACEKKAAFQLDPSTASLSRPNTRTALGSAAHALIEAVLRGEAPPAGAREAWLEEKWAEVLDSEAQKLAAAWGDRIVPPTERWPGLIATRRRLIKRLNTLATATTEAGESHRRERREGIPPLPWIERWVEDPKTGLAGKVDLVEEAHGQVRVIDHKTGVHQDEITATQRRQLLIYAHLASIDLGRPVDEAVVLDAKGNEASFSIEPAEVKDAVSEVVAARERFEAARETGSFIASPSAESCRFCSFRIICLDYWCARDSHGAVGEWPPSDIRGSATQHEVGNVVTLWSGDHEVQLVLADGVTLGAATEIAAVDLDRIGEHGARMRWNSLIRMDWTQDLEG